MKHKRLFSILILFLLLAGCAGKSPTGSRQAVRTGFFFDTFIQISLYDSQDETVLDGCMELAGRYEALFSRTKEGSDIWNINHAKGSPVTVDAETIALLNDALYHAARSEGVFDPTIGAVSTLWNFSTEPKGPVPDSRTVKEACTHVGYENVTINGNEVRLEDPATQLDPGAIAKGYIADRMREYLLDAGVTSALINLGGNVLAIGEKPDGSPFRVGVQMPFAAQGEVLTTVSVRDKSLVSSGNYERFFEADGMLYHHILDPATGYPANNGVLGVTILADNSVDADALSTICFLMGKDAGLALIEQTDGAEALFITGTPYDSAHYEVFTSSGFPST